MQVELKDLARQLPREAGPAVEDKLLEAFRRRKRARVRRWVVGIAAALVVGLAVGYRATHIARNQNPHKSAAATLSATEFVVLPYSQSGVPLENPVIVHMTLGRSELGALGVSAAVVNAHQIGGRERFAADVLVGQDGVARAVRFVQ